MKQLALDSLEIISLIFQMLLILFSGAMFFIFLEVFNGS